jgi:hypothetical protein
MRSLDALRPGDRGQVDGRRMNAVALPVGGAPVGVIVGTMKLKRDFVADVPGLADRDQASAKVAGVLLALEQLEAGCRREA